MAEQDRKISNLFVALLNDLSLLIRKEIELAKAETSEKVSQMSRGAVMLVAGGIIAFSGFLFLLLCITYALENVVAPWLAALIVGGVVLVIGLVMLASGRNQVRPGNLAPTRTFQSVREDAAVAKAHVSRGS